MKLNFFTDPGHGWVEVPISLVRELNIANKISHYSYRKHNLAFLEEDCDAGLLIEALKARGDSIELVEINEPNRESFVRNLPRFFH